MKIVELGTALCVTIEIEIQFLVEMKKIRKHKYQCSDAVDSREDSINCY